MVADLPTKLEPINFLKEKTFHCLLVKSQKSFFGLL